MSASSIAEASELAVNGAALTTAPVPASKSALNPRSRVSLTSRSNSSSWVLRAREKEIARAAPPAPSSSIFLSSTSTPASVMAFKAPGPSVPKPINLSCSWTTVLIEPMERSVAEISSTYFMASILWGIVMLRPRKLLNARIPAKAPLTSSTRQAI